MIKYYCILLGIASALLYPAEIIAQKQADNWVFGDSVGISFKSSVPVPFVSGTGALSATSSVSTMNGDLLYYSGIPGPLVPISHLIDRFAIFDSTHQIIQGGDGILCHDATVQGSIFLPAVNDSNLFYLFHIGFPFKFYYTLVDKRLNNGNGAVVLKNQLVFNDNCDEYMQAVRHANGRDWWLILHHSGSFSAPGFYKFILDENGIHLHSNQLIGDTLSSHGYFVASNNGERLLISDAVFNELELYDFNRCTGNITYRADLTTRVNSNPTNTYIGPLGCSISPNSNIAYASTTKGLYQWDLTSINIPGTKQTIYEMNDSILPLGDSSLFLAHLLGPDDRIYIVTNLIDDFTPIFHTSNLNLNVIENPNQLGLGCNFNPLTQYMGGRRSILGLPTLPYYGLGRLLGSPCDTLTGISEQYESSIDITIYPNPTSEYISIDFNDNVGNVTVEIIDIFGREVSVDEIHTNATGNIKLQGASGIYNVRVILKSGSVISRRIIKQ